MNLFRKIAGVLIGTLIMGLGIAFFNLSSFGFDGLSCVVICIQRILNVKYTIGYLIINLVFFLLMIVFLRKQIGIGTVINYLLTGVFSDIFMSLFYRIGLGYHNMVINIIFGLIGVFFLGLGIALYANANLGITPYDALPLIITNNVVLFGQKIKYHIARKIVDGSCILFGIVVGMLILGNRRLVGINTIISFIFVGYIVTFTSRYINKYIYQKDDKTFE